MAGLGCPVPPPQSLERNGSFVERREPLLKQTPRFVSETVLNPEQIAAQIARGECLRHDIAEAKKALAEVERSLLTLAPGTYRASEGQSATRVVVVDPSAAIKPTPEAIAAVRKMVGDDHFHALFERCVSHAPVKGFRDVLKALCTPAKIKKVTALCEVPGKRYLRWS